MFKILILFFVGIVACFFLAKLILKFIPKKVQPILTIALYATAIFLAYLSYNSVMEPIHFNKEKVKRYTKVIENLKIIRDAQAAHRVVTREFAPTGEALVKFIDTAQFAVTRDTNLIRKVDKGGGIEVEEEYRRTDTIGYTDVRAAFVGRDYKNMMTVPAPEGNTAKFTMKIGEVVKNHGDKRKVYEVKVDKAVVLEGLSDELIRLEKTTENNDQVKGADIRVGSLADVTNNGNWPPSYDVGDVKKD